MRLYWTSSSYPEIREIRSWWERQRTWFRAFRSALNDNRFVAAIVVPLGILLTAISVADVGLVNEKVAVVVGLVLAGLVVVTWGGDVIRPHLRRVSETARDSCPGCGYRLAGAPVEEDGHLRCSECGARVPELIFEPPYAIPRAFLAMPILAPDPP